MWLFVQLLQGDPLDQLTTAYVSPWLRRVRLLQGDILSAQHRIVIPSAECSRPEGGPEVRRASASGGEWFPSMVVSELWCTAARHETSASGPCRLPWHVAALTFLLAVCGIACAAAAFIAIAGRRAVIGARRQRSMVTGCLGVALASFIASMSMTQSAWVGTDVWAAPWYLSYVRMAIWSGWYQFGLSMAPETARTHARKIYVDVGARYYDTSPRWFKEHYPRGDDFHIIAFEVEPRFREYYKQHPEVELHSVAAGTKDGTVTFDFGMAHQAGDTGSCERCTEVPMIDFAKFLQDRVRKEDFVVAKIDVEGSEYVLFDHLLETGSAALIDELFVEWHGWRFADQWERIARLQERLQQEAGVLRMHYWL